MRLWWILLGVACTEPTPALPTPTPAPAPVATPTPPPPVTEGPPDGPRTWVQITGHPCAVDDQGWMECWWSDEPGWLGNTDEVTPQQLSAGARLYGTFGNPFIYAHAPDQLIQVVHCGNPGAWPCFPPGIPYREVNWNAGITASGIVHVWDNASDGPVVQHPQGAWHQLSLFGGAAAVDLASGVLGVASTRSEAPYYVEFDLPVGTSVEQVVGGVNGNSVPPYVGVYVLTASGDILGFGDVDASEFAHPPYEQIHGSRGWRPTGNLTSMCAMRAGSHIIDCSNGDTHDFGPLRAFTTMQGRDFLSIPDGGTARTVNEENVCVITTDNAIHCVGRLYPPDLVEKLEALPR